MKRTLSFLLFLSVTIISTSLNAQAPNGINYQAVIRTNTGTLASNQAVVIRARILQTTANGTAVYSERHNLTTDQFGLVNFVIGNGVFLAGNPFANLNWGNGPYFLELGVAFTNQVNPVVYMPYGTQQMMSVPYALYAKSSGNLLNQWSYGAGSPLAASGNVGDYYLDTATGNVYSKLNNTTWVLITNITGPQGPAGPTGATGLTGPQGPVGATGATGAVGPQGPQGIQGIAGPTGATGLTGAAGVAGPQGPQGIQGIAGPPGTNGTNGTAVLNGITNPAAGTGVNGDFYINTATNELFGPKANGTWPAGVSLVGPQGIQGATGATGLTGPQSPAGATGATGAAGPQGPAGAAGPAGNGFQNGNQLNQLLYWDGSNWVTLNPGSNGQVLSICNGTLGWVTMAGACNTPAALSTINCAGAATTGTLTSGIAANGVSTAISYTGGNAGTYGAQSVSSTGVVGLTATLAAGTLANGNGSVTYTITGTPASAGTASFAITLGGQSCSFTVSVAAAAPQFPAGTVNCAGATAVVNVTNPTTGLIWMDRNLGASQVATSSTDQNAYGDLYQWGRRSDGHQCRTSPPTATLSSVDQPAHGNFILASNAPYDWRSPQNTNLWQGVNGVNNPCPSGYRLPTETELNNERLSWSSNNGAGAFASPLKWTLAGYRYSSNGSLYDVGTLGYYWSSTVSGTYSRYLYFNSSSANMYDYYRANGFSVRCLKN